MKLRRRFSQSCLFAALAGSLALPSTLSAQVLAVEFGGAYNGSNSNADKTGYTLENGDFDGEGDAEDRCGFIPMGTLFLNINDTNGVGNNNVLYHGTQFTILDSTAADPGIGIFRLLNGDRLQCGTGAPQSGVRQLTFAPHVVKSDFLNGADSSSELFFEDAAGSVSVSLAGKTGPVSVNRALVKNGSNWYVSTTTTTSSSASDLSINGFAEMWLPYDPDANLYLSATTLAGTAVSGSTFNDIQAFGAVIQQDDIGDGSSANVIVDGFSARMATAPPPITVLNSDFGRVPDNSGQVDLENNAYTFSFEAGATADKLIVTLSSETGGSGPAVITYDGVPLSFVANTGSNKVKGIWYLDNPFTGGVADLVVDMTSYSPVNGIGFGVVSISGSAPGVSMGDAAGGLEVSLFAPVDGSLIVSAYGSNTVGALTVPTDHTKVYAATNIGSAAGAAAYLNNTAAGAQTVTYAQGGTPNSHSTGAAVFSPIVEPPPITVVNSDSGAVPNNSLPPEESLNGTPYTISFDAGATADKLIVALSSETGGSGPPIITYNDEELTFVTGSGSGKTKGVWYLDNPFAGGAADLVIDLTGYDAVNGVGFGVVSIAGSAPGVAAGSADPGLGVSITAPADGSFVISAHTSESGGPAPTVPLGHTKIYSSNNIGSADGAAAYLNNVPAGLLMLTYTQDPGTPNGTGAAAFAPAAAAGNTFADWIAGFPGVGAEDGLDDDPDGDGIDNGVENFLGTAPDEFSQGLLAGTATGTTTFTFTHPQSADPASDLTATYRWSTDLANWYDGDNVDGPGGLTVNIVPDPVGPPATTVTATASQAVPTLFLRVEVN